MSSRKKLYICRCERQCSGSPGGGHLQARSTRYRHNLDERTNAASRSFKQISTQYPRCRADCVASTEQTPNSIAPLTCVGLVEAEVNVIAALMFTGPTQRVAFRRDPTSVQTFKMPTRRQLFSFNTGDLALQEAPRSNQAILAIDARLCELHSILMSQEASTERTAALLSITTQMHRLNREKASRWLEQKTYRGAPVFVNTEQYFHNYGPLNGLARVASLLSLTLGHLFMQTRRGLRIQLSGTVDVALQFAPDGLSSAQSVPKDPRGCISEFNLDPVTRTYAICIDCHSLYPISSSHHTSQARCTYRSAPLSAVCNQVLYKPPEESLSRNPGVFLPIRKYIHHDLKSWLGRLLSRSGMEDLIETRCTSPRGDQVDDIWASSVFRGLRGPDDHPFYPGPSTEGRVVFSFSFDGFNPFRNQTAKQSVSSQGIWLVLLNLPPHLRFLQHNIHLVGIIPGPDKPSKDKINHYVQLVVNNLLELWNPGIFLSRTFKYPEGRLYRGMLVPVVCDMLAARQLIGYSASPNSHYICTGCDIGLNDIHVLDRTLWPRKSSVQVKQVVTAWKNADSDLSREKIFSACGWRWSPLFDLPYWDPVSFTVVDSMHTLDLNLIQHHVRSLFGIDIEKDGGDGTSTSPSFDYSINITSRANLKLLSNCEDTVNANTPSLLYELLTYPPRILHAFCSQWSILRLGCDSVIGNNWVLAHEIVTWRRTSDSEDLRAFLLQYTPPDASLHAGDDNDEGDEEDEEGEDEEDEGEDEEEEDDEDDDDASQQLPPAPPGVDHHVAYRTLKRLARSSASGDTQDRSKALHQVSAAHLAYICDVLNVDRVDVDVTKRRTAKSNLIALLAEQLDRPDIEEQLATYSKPIPRAVLGKDVMHSVWEDMLLTTLPSWIVAAPRNWGTSQRGKLSADNWRVICSVHLPVTLIRIWRHPSTRQRQLLHNFMDLAAAVRIANLRVSSPQQVDAYNTCMHRYLTGIMDLFPHVKLRPTHHLALHIGDGIEAFGPSHSHRANFFERYIKFFHLLNTNLHQGQLEATLSISAARTANLCGLLSDEVIKHSIPSITKAMQSVSREDHRGIRLEALLDPSIPSFTPDSHPQVIDLSDEMLDCVSVHSPPTHRTSTQAHSIKELVLCGVTYNTASSRRCNSTVIVQVPSYDGSKHVVASIQCIFEAVHFPAMESRPLYIVATEYPPFDETGERDFYRQYGFAAGFLCHTIATKTHVVPAKDIISHCAVTPIDVDGVRLHHIIPLDQTLFRFEGQEQ